MGFVHKDETKEREKRKNEQRSTRHNPCHRVTSAGVGSRAERDRLRGRERERERERARETGREDPICNRSTQLPRCARMAAAAADVDVAADAAALDQVCGDPRGPAHARSVPVIS